MRVLITGIFGFAGSHLCEYIVNNHPDVEVFGIVRTFKNSENIQDVLKKITISAVDITDLEQMKSCIKKISPDVIFHLAAQSYIHSSWENPGATLFTNIIGQNNLFEAVRSILRPDYNPRIVVVGSSEEYGFVPPKLLPVKETEELCPRSPYAVSKIGQDLMGYQYFASYEMNIIRLRVFNHTGPRRPSVFGISGFGHTIALIEKGKLPPVIKTRDLSAVRDFTDVRDIVRAYWLSAIHCLPGEPYNVCSGRGLSIQEILHAFIGFSSVKNIKLLPDSSDKRPNDGGALIGDNTKFVKATGWKPEYDFLKNTVSDILEYWRKNA